MVQDNLIKILEASFRSHWELPLYTDYSKNSTMTYGEVAERIARLHLLFKEIGVEKTDKIALIGRNTPHWTTTYLAVITYGAVIVPILQDFNPNDVHHIVNHSGATLLFCSDKHWDSLEEDKMENLTAVFSIDDFRCVHQQDGQSIQRIMGSLDAHFAKAYPKGFTKDHVHYKSRTNEEIFMISYTSGSTGFSKGVMISGRALVGNIRYGIESHLLEKGDRVLTFLPLAHAYGMAFDFLTVTCVGAHSYLLNKVPSPKVLIKAFGEVHPTIIFTVPLVMEKIYRKQLQPSLSTTSMRFALNVPLLDNYIYSQVCNKLTEALGGEFKEVIIGGAPLNREVEDFLRKIGFRFTVGYGMTECAPLIAHAYHNEFRPYSCGKVLPNMEVRIDSADPENEIGEILVRGDNVMSGYYNNPEATKNVFTDDGWLRTGDMGLLDKDGHLYIKGRCKSMILGANGQNIYPEQIEDKLNNLPFVMESLVIERDGKLIALVYPDYTAIDDAHIRTQDVPAIMEENRKQLNNMVASYENIAQIVVYPTEFEKTPKKSIKRYLYANITL